jgi:hypothetical protein
MHFKRAFKRLDKHPANTGQNVVRCAVTLISAAAVDMCCLTVSL